MPRMRFSPRKRHETVASRFPSAGCSFAIKTSVRRRPAECQGQRGYVEIRGPAKFFRLALQKRTLDLYIALVPSETPRHRGTTPKSAWACELPYHFHTAEGGSATRFYLEESPLCRATTHPNLKQKERSLPSTLPRLPCALATDFSALAAGKC